MEKRIPVVVIRQIGETDTILRVLQEYGIRCAEITFRTPCAEEALIYACKNYPQMLIGAGTGHQRRSVQAGACGGRKIYCVARFFGRGGGRLQGAKRRVLSRLRHSYGDHEGAGMGDHDSKVFPCRNLRRTQRDEGAQRALSVGQVYSDGRGECGEYAGISRV